MNKLCELPITVYDCSKDDHRDNSVQKAYEFQILVKGLYGWGPGWVATPRQQAAFHACWQEAEGEQYPSLIGLSYAEGSPGSSDYLVGCNCHCYLHPKEITGMVLSGSLWKIAQVAAKAKGLPGVEAVQFRVREIGSTAEYETVSCS